MMKTKIWNINDRVEYIVIRSGKKFHKIGFVKAYHKGLFKKRYIVCTADKIREIDEVKPNQILCLAPKKENYKQTKTNENAI